MRKEIIAWKMKFWDGFFSIPWINFLWLSLMVHTGEKMTGYNSIVSGVQYRFK